MVRLKDIAEETGYSISVVSRALKPNKDKFDTTSEKTKKHIRKVAEKMGYFPNINASLLRRGRTPAIGVFLPPYSSSLVADLVFGLSEVSMKYRYPLFYAPGYTEEAFAHFLHNSERMSSAGIIAFFSAAHMLDHPGFQAKVKQELRDNMISDFPYERLRTWNQAFYNAITLFANNGGKVVLLNETPVDYDYEPLGVRSVCCNDHSGGKKAAEYLLKHGCLDFVCIRNWSRCSCDRFKAFSQYLIQNKQKCIDIDFFDPKELRDYKYLSSCLDKKFAGLKAPVGVFITSDLMLLEVCNYCRNRGLEIGQDIKIVSYNNQEFVNHLGSKVISIKQPMREAGKTAMYKLIEMLQEKDVKSELVEPELIVR